MEELKGEWMAGVFSTAYEVGVAYGMFYEMTEPGANMGIDYEAWYDSIGSNKRIVPGEPYDTFKAWRDKLESIIAGAIPGQRMRDIWGMVVIYGMTLEDVAEAKGTNRETVRQIVYDCDGRIEVLIQEPVSIVY